MDIYKRGSKNRGYSFKLSLKQFSSLIKQNCFYCDSEPQNKTKFSTNGVLKYNGIDRFNNDIGYILSNCVPCCKYCNYAKRNTDIKTFLDWIYRISYRKDKLKKFYEGLNSALYIKSSGVSSRI
ncbi:hypothetical protein A3F66_07060 [candidate division TM6 bacterium RIFCSPHIGHO2_12_FULL_32_22]|nr:MAG: hypothetical protein A3F66_07060 [candidate division TM6 bacterium RIFCSPHIGHO2_12_FULL_32_22]